MRQRVLQQSPVLEAVLDARLDFVELVAQPHHARADILAMALDDPACFVRDALGHGDTHLAERAHRHRQNRLGVSGDAEAGDALAVEQRQHDARFYV